MASKKAHFSEEKRNPTILFRSETNKVICGVCGGLGEVFNIDPTLVRALFALATLFGGSGLLFYIVLWIVIPKRSKLTNTTDENIRENLDEMKERVHSFTKDFSNEHNGRPTAGLILLILGVIFLLGNFGYIHYFNISKLWPVFLIVLGFLIISKKNNR